MTSPRRVVHVVCTDNFSGVERYVSYVAPILSERGWDVTVVGGHEERMRAALGDVRYVRGESVASAASALVGCDRSTVVHAHMTAAESAAAAVHIARRFPVVATRHFAAARGSSTFGKLAAPLIRRSLTKQIAISDFVAAAIGEPSVTIRNGVPVDHLPAPHDRQTILVVQRLEREKRTGDILRAWARTALPANGWQLEIVGDGNERGELTELSRELAVEGSVEFLGVQSDVGVRMRRASVFVATAPAEPFGLSVGEAMAAALPIVCSRGGAHLETVGAVTTRWLFEPGNAEQLAEMLQALASDDAERERYGRALQEHQRGMLSIESHVDQLERLYTSVMK